MELKDSKQEEVKKLEEEFKMLDDSFSSNKRYLMECSTKLSEIQNEIEKLDKFKGSIEAVQDELDLKIKDISEHLKKREINVEKHEMKIIKDFKTSFISNIENIQLTAFKLDTYKTESKKITIEELNDYIPFLENKPLKRYCSASDQSKIIFAYLLALQEVAIQQDNRNHLGFTLFDEPIQQNPGGNYRSTIIEFFSHLEKNAKGQIIIFTKLEKDEENNLKESSFFKILKGERFLTEHS